ncbi:MAG: EamA family transporter, partial [Bacteroidota bacterium]
PLYSIILAIWLFKENRELSPAFYFGLGLIVLSVILQMFRVATQHKKINLTVPNL